MNDIRYEVSMSQTETDIMYAIYSYNFTVHTIYINSHWRQIKFGKNITFNIAKKDKIQDSSAII